MANDADRACRSASNPIQLDPQVPTKYRGAANDRHVPTGDSADQKIAVHELLECNGVPLMAESRLRQLIDESEISSRRAEMRGLRIPATSARRGQPFDHPAVLFQLRK
jgi:hypothetical protein